MREWFNSVNRPELEAELCHHLDNQLELRELAQNPYVLTLMCAIFAGEGEQPGRPASRTGLYREAFQFMVAYCRNHFGSLGYKFDKDDLNNTKKIAFELMARPVASPFEFTEFEVNEFVKDSGHLARSWSHARLIVLANEKDAAHSFMHPTLHEFLAGQELAQRLNSGEFDPIRAGTDPLWMRAGVFAADSVGAESPLWQALKTTVENPDDFGLLLLRVASLLTEVRATDGGLILIGVDIRPRIWKLFLRSPSPESYAEALAQLCPLYAIEQAESAELTPKLLPRLLSLNSKLSPSHEGRSRLVTLIAQLRFTDEVVVDSDIADLAALMGHEPDEPSSLASASEMRSAVDLMSDLVAFGEGNTRTTRIRRAYTQTEEAEEELLKEFHTTTKRRPTLATSWMHSIFLGTLRVRDAILNRLLTFHDKPDLLVQALRVLRQFSIGDSVDHVFELLSSNTNPSVRVEAALAAGGALCDKKLRQLCDYAGLEETDVEVRKAAIEALARSRAVWMVSKLAHEDPRLRLDQSERVVIGGYLATIARATPIGEQPTTIQAPIAHYFVTRLRSDDVSPFEVIHSAACSDIELIRPEWHRLLKSNDAEELWPAVCEAIRHHKDDHSINLVIRKLKSAAKKPDSNKFKYHATLAVAFIKTEKISELRKYCSEHALWKFSLETDTLVFSDRLIRAAEFGVPGFADNATIETYLQLKNDEVSAEWDNAIRLLLEDRAHRYAAAFEEVDLSIEELTTRRLHRELTVMHYVFIRHIKEFLAFREHIEQSTRVPAEIRNIFRGRDVEKATGIPKSSLGGTRTWKRVSALLKLKRNKGSRTPTLNSQVTKGELADSRQNTPAEAILAAEDVRKKIESARISDLEKKGLLKDLDEKPGEAERIQKVLDTLTGQ